MHCYFQANAPKNAEVACLITRDSTTDKSGQETGSENRTKPNSDESPGDTTSEMHKQLAREQRAESGWGPMIEFLEGKTHNVTARLKRKSAEYGMVNGLLHKRVETETGRKLAIVVPATSRPRVLYESHDSPMAGHQGLLKSERRIRSQYYWTSMKEDIKLYIDSCIVCKTMKNRTQKLKGLLRPLEVVDTVLDRVGMDKFGPIQNSRRNYAYVFVIVDYCSRFIFAKATTDGKAATALEVLREFIQNHGVPKEILTDNGSEFKGIFAEKVRNWTKLTHSSPMHPQTNGLVERANKTLSEMLRTVIKDTRHSDWDQKLPGVVYGYNEKVHDITRFSPFFLKSGTSGHRRNCLSEAAAEEPLPELSVEKARDLAKFRTLQSQLKEKARYDRNRWNHTFQVGDEVVVDRSIMKKGQSHRFNKRRDGPFRISDVFDNNTVEIIGARGSCRVNIDRCHRIARRPAYLDFCPDTEESDHDDEFGEPNPPEISLTQAELNSNLTPEEKAELEEDAALDKMTPIRRSTRITRRPQRLIETMPLVSDSTEIGDIHSTELGDIHSTEISDIRMAEIGVDRDSESHEMDGVQELFIPPALALFLESARAEFSGNHPDSDSRTNLEKVGGSHDPTSGSCFGSAAASEGQRSGTESQTFPEKGSGGQERGRHPLKH